MIFLSHKDPNKLLMEHLKEVNEYANKNNELFNNEIELVSLLHDFGKYTTFFQKHLKLGIKVSNSDHSFISAITCAWIALKQYNDDYTPLLLYSVILSHHGDIKNIDAYLPKSKRSIENDDYDILDKIDNVNIQLKDMKRNSQYIIDDYNGTNISGYIKLYFKAFDEQAVNDTLISLKKLKYNFDFKDDNNDNEKLYFKHNYIYSKLIMADKYSASRVLPIKEKFFSFIDLQNEKNIEIKQKNTSINNIRNDIYSNVLNNISKNYENNIFTITAPTGTGKTYTGFLSAIKLKEKNNMDGNIIYALPFTSIINQNYNIIKDLYDNILNCKDNNCEKKDDTDYIMMHHHLSELNYDSKDTENENYDIMQIQQLYETWDSGVIITTFVQLIETLIGNRNRMLKKFNKFYESVILIDEIQSIDIHLYKLLQETLYYAIKYLKCKVIIMTATKPLIFENELELLENNQKYFEMMNRNKLKYINKEINIDEFVKMFKDNYESQKSYMIICNTIAESLKIYEKIQDINKNIFYLSSNLVSYDKENIIKNIYDIQKKNIPHILVTTQVVEAGVDLDFDIVYRDFAPLQSIIQSAGRCNRNGKKNIGIVYIVNLINEKNKEFSSMIYDSGSIEKTKEILNKYAINEIVEKKYYDMINEYYKIMKEFISNDTSNKYLEAMKNLDFDIIGTFNLIKYKGNVANVFCIIDDKAQDVFNKFITILSIKDLIERKKELLKVKNDVQKYCVSIREEAARECNYKEDLNIYYVPKEECVNYYDKEGIKKYSSITGFNKNMKLDLFY